MAAPSLLFPPSDVTEPQRDFAAEATLERVRVGRDGSQETGSPSSTASASSAPRSRAASDSVRLAIDLRDTGRDAWQVACEMAGRGFTLDTASHRVIVVRLSEDDIRNATQHRLAPALQLALWATPVS